MSKGYFVIQTQIEADRLTQLKGVERYVGERMYYGTRTDKPVLDTVDYHWIPSNVPQPSETAVWDLPAGQWQDGETLVKQREDTLEANQNRERLIQKEVFDIQRDVAIARLRQRGEIE